MYPSGELTRLANRKALLQARIAVARWEAAVAGAELANRLAMIDRVVEQWRKIAPFMKLLRAPVGLLAVRFLLKRWRKPKAPPVVRAPRKSTLSTIMSTLPLLMRGARLVMQMRGARS